MSQNDGAGDTTHVYAWIAVDANGIEGIVTAPVPGLGIVPLACTGRGVADQMEPFAQIAAHARGTTTRLVRFERAETLKEVRP